MQWTQIQSVNWDPPSCRKKWQLTPVFLFGKSHGQRSLVGCSVWGCRESDDLATEYVHVVYTLAYVYR